MTTGEPLQLSQEMHDTVWALSLRGRLDAHTGDCARGALTEGTTAHQRLLLDCSQVTFLSSAGLHVIVSGHRAARDRGAKLAVVLPANDAAQTIQISGIDKVVSFYPSRQAALDALNAP